MKFVDGQAILYQGFKVQSTSTLAYQIKIELKQALHSFLPKTHLIVYILREYLYLMFTKLHTDRLILYIVYQQT